MLLELHSHIVSISNTVWMDKNDKNLWWCERAKESILCVFYRKRFTYDESRTPKKWNMNVNAHNERCMVYVGWSANASTQHNSLFILAVARMPVNTVRFANLAKRDWTICNTFCLFICIYLLHLYRFLLHLCRAINKNVHLTVVAHIDLERCSKFSSSFLAKSMTMTTMMKTLLNIDFTFQVRWTEACVQHLKSSIRIPFELINLMKVQVWISAKKTNMPCVWFAGWYGVYWSAFR